MEHNEGIKKAKEKLEEISNDPIMQRIADWKEDYIIEMNTTKTTSERKGYKQGLERGREQGEKIGIKQGEINEKKEIAKKLKQKNLTLKEISEITGLSIEEIEKL